MYDQNNLKDRSITNFKLKTSNAGCNLVFILIIIFFSLVHF